MQDNNLRIAFDYKYPDSPALMVYEAFGGSIFAEGSIRVRKTIVGDEAVKIYSQLTGKSIPDIHKEAGNINWWGAYDHETEKERMKTNRDVFNETFGHIQFTINNQFYHLEDSLTVRTEDGEDMKFTDWLDRTYVERKEENNDKDN